MSRFSTSANKLRHTAGSSRSNIFPSPSRSRNSKRRNVSPSTSFLPPYSNQHYHYGGSNIDNYNDNHDTYAYSQPQQPQLLHQEQFFLTPSQYAQYSGNVKYQHNQRHNHRNPHVNNIYTNPLQQLNNDDPPIIQGQHRYYSTVPYRQVGYTDYETQVIHVPVQKRKQQYVTIQHLVDYVPEVTEELVGYDVTPLETVHHRLQYVPVQSKIVHLPVDQVKKLQMQRSGGIERGISGIGIGMGMGGERYRKEFNEYGDENEQEINIYYDREQQRRSIYQGLQIPSQIIEKRSSSRNSNLRNSSGTKRSFDRPSEHSPQRPLSRFNMYNNHTNMLSSFGKMAQLQPRAPPSPKSAFNRQFQSIIPQIQVNSPQSINADSPTPNFSNAISLKSSHPSALAAQAALDPQNKILTKIPKTFHVTSESQQNSLHSVMGNGSGSNSGSKSQSFSSIASSHRSKKAQLEKQIFG